MDLQKRAVGIVAPGEDMRLLNGVEIFLKGRNGLLDVGRYGLLVFPGQLQQYLEVVPEGGNLLPAGEDIRDAGSFGLDLARLCRVLPDPGIRELRFQLF
jgi:hypothetical protein